MKLEVCLLGILVKIVFHVLLLPDVVLASSHAKNCSVSLDCDINSFLQCKNGTCECYEYLKYEESSKKCRTPVGGDCTNAYFSQPECVRNAHCHNYNSSVSQCACNDNYVVTTSGHCQGTFGHSPCDNKTNLCNSDLGLACIGQSKPQCICANQLYEWSKDRNSCSIASPGQPCSYNEDDLYQEVCSGNSHCILLESSSTDGICECKPGFNIGSSGHCDVGFGQACKPDTNNHCSFDRHLICSNATSTCICEDQLTLMYDSVKDTCVSRLGQNCTLTTDYLRCALFAECKTYGVPLYGRCQCQQNYTSTPTDTCLLSYGQLCDSNNDYCNSYEQLTCIAGNCLCQPGHWESSKGKCGPTYGHKCNSTFGCDSRQFMECNSQGVCDCDDPAALHYDPVSHSCLSRTYCHMNQGSGFFIRCSDGKQCMNSSIYAVDEFIGVCANSGASISTKSTILFPSSLFSTVCALNFLALLFKRSLLYS